MSTDISDKPVSRLLRPLHWIEDASLLGLVTTLVILSISQILMRNLGSGGLVWAENALRILVLWIAMFGAMRASRDGEHIAIDIVTRYVAGPFKQFISAFTLLSSGLICLLAAWYCLQFVQIEYEDQARAFLQVPTWLCEAIIPFAFTVMGCRFLAQCARQLRRKSV